MENIKIGGGAAKSLVAPPVGFLGELYRKRSLKDVG